MSILVSINCITYNHEKYIADAIESFLNQKTNFDFEIIIGEDCSTDNTMKIVRKYEEKYSDKIVVITSEKNVGMMENEKRVIAASRGKYIAECEGDDYWIDPYKLQKQVDYMESHPECTLCFHNAEKVDVNKKYKCLVLSDKISQFDYNAGEMISLVIPTASRLYRKFTMEDLPKWYIKSIVGDFPSQIIITSYGYAHYIPQVMSAYRVGVKNSATFSLADGQENQIRNQKGRIEMYDNINSFLEYKYDYIFKQMKRESEFALMYLNGEIKNIKKEEFKELYRKLSLKNRIKLHVKAYFPKIYDLLKKCYRKWVDLDILHR